MIAKLIAISLFFNKIKTQFLLTIYKKKMTPPQKAYTTIPIKYIFALCFCAALCVKSIAQELPATPLGHSHNDYKRSTPFSTAVESGMGSIEADVFLKQGELCVAHTRWKCDRKRTLDKLYLQPIAEAMRNGKAYKVQLVIDIKNHPRATLSALIKNLGRYPDVFNEKSPFTIIISGKRPAREEWENIPNYIYFDGRPSENYSDAQQKRIGMVSANFRHYKHYWKKLEDNKTDANSPLKKFVDVCHAKGKKIRLWNAPDNNKAWKKFVALGVDFINTNKPLKLSLFFQKSVLPTANGQ